MIKKAALPLALTLIIVGCSPDQAPPTQTSPQLSSKTATPPQINKAVTESTTEKAPSQPFIKAAEPHVLSAEIQSGKTYDQIKITLGQGFQTKAVNTSNVKLLRIWVTGPGINGKIYASGGDVDGYINIATPTGNAATFDQIPKGKNRVLTAQFYDIAKTALTTVYAKGIYSSDGGTGSVVLNRAQIPLAEVIENLHTTQPALLESIDVEQLKTILANVMNWNGTSFTVDPSRFVPIQVVNTLVAEGKIPANLQAALTPGSVYIANTSSFSFVISGLIGDDKVRVRLQDPTSPLLESGNVVLPGLTINNILPGTWELSVDTDEAGIEYTGLFTPETYTFVAGVPQNRVDLVLDHAAPSIDELSITKGPRNTTLLIKGENFHKNKATNTVSFNDGVNPAMNAVVTAATSTQLTVTVPEVIDSTVQNVTVTVGSKTSAAEPFEVQKVIFVKPDAEVLGGALGTKWSDAITLESAVTNAGVADVLWIKKGTYNVGKQNRDGLVIPREMSLYGGFNGTETNLEQRNLSLNPTIISGDTNGNDAPYTEGLMNQTSVNDASRADNSYHVVKVMQTEVIEEYEPIPAVILDSLIISGGNANAPLPDMWFGPFYEPSGPPCDDPCEEPPDVEFPYDSSGGGLLTLRHAELTNVTLTNNTAYLGGGHANVTEVKYENTTVSHNHAKNDGGGIFGLDKSWEDTNKLDIHNSHFESNRADKAGGAVASGTFSEPPVSFYDNVFINNYAGQKGGAVASTGNRNDFERNAFIQNSSGGSGGAWSHNMSDPYGRITANYNIFYQNHAATNGGGMTLSGEYEGNGDIKLQNNSFIENSSDQEFAGQALWWEGSDYAYTLKLINNLWIGNDIARGSDYPLILSTNMTDLTDLASLVHENNNPAFSPADDQPAGDPASVYGINPLFVDANNPVGIDGIWKTADDGIIPGLGSVLIGAGKFMSNYDEDILRHEYSWSPPSIGAYNGLTP